MRIHLLFIVNLSYATPFSAYPYTPSPPVYIKPRPKCRPKCIKQTVKPVRKCRVRSSIALAGKYTRGKAVDAGIEEGSFTAHQSLPRMKDRYSKKDLDSAPSDLSPSQNGDSSIGLSAIY
jgi:hypothetical protein